MCCNNRPTDPEEPHEFYQFWLKDSYLPAMEPPPQIRSAAAKSHQNMPDSLHLRQSKMLGQAVHLS